MHFSAFGLELVGHARGEGGPAALHAALQLALQLEVALVELVLWGRSGQGEGREGKEADRGRGRGVRGRERAGGRVENRV